MAAPITTYNVFSRRYWLGDVDARPLAAFRIAFAALLLKDALYHLPLASVFYSDAGILPRVTLLELARSQRFSLMDAVSHPWMAILFFLLWTLVIVGLLVGYRTRLMSILNFILIFSIHDRNLFLLSGADTFMRVLSFWLMFIPANGYYSVDAWLARRQGQQPPPKAIFAFPVRMIQLQVAVVYFFAGLVKVLGEQWRSGIAMYYVLQLDTWLLPPGVWFRNLAPTWLLAFISHMTVVIELAFPVLVFSPVMQPALRILGLALMAGLHIGIGVLMNIPDFSIIMLISYLTLFEPGWIEPIERLVRRLFGLSPAVEDRPLPEVAPVAVLQTAHPSAIPTGVALPQTAVTTAGETDDSADTSSQPAEARTAEHDSSSPIQPAFTSSRAVQAAVLGLLMLGVIWWNFVGQNENGLAFPEMPTPVRNAFWYTGLWQGWAMFSPLPLQVDSWISIPGKFEDGTEMELRTGEPVTDEPIRWLFGPYTRWVKYEEHIRNEREDALLREWARYYCREYNDVLGLPEGQRLATLEIHYRFQRSPAPGEPDNPVGDERLWRHWCYEEYAY